VLAAFNDFGLAKGVKNRTDVHRQDLKPLPHLEGRWRTLRFPLQPTMLLGEAPELPTRLSDYQSVY
jgi:hypothetical protein